MIQRVYRLYKLIGRWSTNLFNTVFNHNISAHVSSPFYHIRQRDRTIIFEIYQNVNIEFYFDCGTRLKNNQSSKIVDVTSPVLKQKIHIPYAMYTSHRTSYSKHFCFDHNMGYSHYCKVQTIALIKIFEHYSLTATLNRHRFYTSWSHMFPTLLGL